MCCSGITAGSREFQRSPATLLHWSCQKTFLEPLFTSWVWVSLQPLEPSDRFLLYTDGMTKTENAAREAFGDRQLERVVSNNRLQPASELSRQVLSELQRWRPAAVNQQDDITLIVVDVL